MRRKRVALVVDYAETEYSQRLIKGALKFTSKNDMELVVFPIGIINSKSYSHEYQNLSIASHITKKNIDGIIFMTGGMMHTITREYLHLYLKSFTGIPVVTIGCEFDDMPCVIHSCEKSMEKLVEHLILKHKKKKFALVSLAGNSTEAKVRETVFRNTLKNHGIKFDEKKLLQGDFTYDSASVAMKSYYDRNKKFDFDALVCLNDEMAFACMDILHSHGIKIPQDIIVTGFDDELHSVCISPSLTTINQNIEKQSYEAAKILHCIFNKQPYPMKKTTTSTALFRQSCGCVSAKDKPWISLNSRGIQTNTSTSSESEEMNRWLGNRNMYFQAVQVFSNLKINLSLQELRGRISFDLRRFDIPAAAVCLFEKPIQTQPFDYFPLPSKITLYSAYDDESGFRTDPNSKPLVFDPHENLIPKKVFSTMNNSIVYTLYRNSYLFGYLVIRSGAYDPTIYTVAVKLISTALAHSFVYNENTIKHQKLLKEYDTVCEVSVTDELTKLLNRRGFISLGKKTLENAMALKQSGLILFGDIDGLKTINDTYGHAAGDKAIIAESSILKSTFRSNDIIGRLGGDEFAILCQGMNEAKFKSHRETLEALCDNYNKTSGAPFKLSISIGCAPFGPETGYDMDKILAMADSILYKEKKLKHKKKSRR